MGAGHNHNHAHGANERNLWIVLALTATFMLAEIIGGLMTSSLALLSDAAHMFTDVAALAISLAAIRIGKRPADASRTFGYYRFEILAAALNASILFIVAFFILYEAYQRFFTPPEIHSTGMLVIAVIGLIVNFIGLRLLQAGSAQSLNVKGAYLEVWSDMLGSLGVIIAALIIKFTHWWQIDPILAVLIGLWVLPRTWILLTQSINILLEGVPEGLHLSEIHDAIKTIPGVVDVHDLHVWAIASGRVNLTAHLLIDRDLQNADGLRQQVHSLLEKQFLITHVTIQLELEPCQPGKPGCQMNLHEHPH